jgi:hypothetical protein
LRVIGGIRGESEKPTVENVAPSGAEVAADGQAIEAEVPIATAKEVTESTEASPVL